MKKTLMLAAVTACIFAASSLQSRAAMVNLSVWAGGAQTAGSAMWTYVGGNLPGGAVEFTASGQLLYDASLVHLAAGTLYYLDYTVQLTPGVAFAAVQLDSTFNSPPPPLGVGSATVIKYINNGLATLTSQNGQPTAWALIPGGLSTIAVHETISVSGSASISGFGNSYYIVPVPEPTTVIAGALLLLPFGVSTLRILRKKRAA